jgi:lipid-A-disaccharide synthase
VESRILAEADKRKPSLAVLIDYPGFNLRIAAKLKSMRIPILYYVSPQVWAWGKKRIGKIKRLVDKMIVVFECEKELYSKEGMEVEWHGHPLLDIVKPGMDKADFLDKAGLKENQRYMGLFPGSRLQEVLRILPAMRDTVRLLGSSGVELKAVVGGVEGIDESVYRKIIGDDFILMKSMTYDIMAGSALNLVASGTATLECAILERPLFVLYKTSPLTYLIARNLIKIPDIGLVNVVAGKRIAPEFVQSDCIPDKIAAEAARFFSEKAYKDNMVNELKKVQTKLGNRGASRKAAESLLEMLRYAKN